MVIPFPINKFIFEPRESSRDSTIVIGSLLLILARLRSLNPGALMHSNMNLFMGNGIRLFFCLLCLGCMRAGILDAMAAIDASIDTANSQAHFPLPGTITITHEKEEQIDSQSFQMDGKPLEVSFVKDVRMSTSNDTLVSIYSFQLPAQEKGLYVLPSISVKIGNEVYRTIPSSYQVKETAASSPPSSPALPKASLAPILFRLEASVKGPTALYPGERTKLFYRISYNRSIDLTRSVLPMIHPAHFQKVGDVQIEDKQLADVTVQDLTQEVEASEVGTFELGPSLIEGYAYTMNLGRKTYDSNLLQSQAPAIVLTVQSFPKLHQPSSFTGALGSLKIEARLESPPSVFVGDHIQLQVKVEGVTNLAGLQFPLLQCQPGFSGFFQTSDLPPLGDVKGKSKFFSIELRPLTSLVHEIPSIEMSSFDPTKGEYFVQHTPAIPLTIQAYPTEESDLPLSTPMPLLASLPSIDSWPTPPLIHLKMQDEALKIQKFEIPEKSMFWSLWLIPIAAAFLWLQRYWQKKMVEQGSKPSLSISRQLLERALKSDCTSSASLQLLEHAFWNRLWEKGWLSLGTFQLEKISKTQELSSIRAFLLELQGLQYGLEKKMDPLQLKKKAQKLFELI